jgi:hypothetical protein
VQRGEDRRAGGMAYLAQRLAEQGRLRPDVSVAEAGHILWLMTSFDAFDLLYSGRGLPVDEVARLLVTAAERAVCRASRSTASPRPIDRPAAGPAKPQRGRGRAR